MAVGDLERHARVCKRATTSPRPQALGSASLHSWKEYCIVKRFLSPEPTLKSLAVSGLPVIRARENKRPNRSRRTLQSVLQRATRTTFRLV